MPPPSRPSTESTEAGAPADEFKITPIEVTPEMADAGAKVLANFFDTKHDDIIRDLAREVWVAMHRAQFLSSK